MKKVCILTSVHPPFDFRVFHREAKSLAIAGYEVVLIAPYTEATLIDGVRVKSVSPPRNRIERMTITTLKIFILALQEKADVYHFHDAELLPFAALLKLFQKRVIYDVHDVIAESLFSRTYIPDYIKPLLSLFLEMFEKMLSRSFDSVITATDAIEDQYKRVGIRASVVKNYPLELSDPIAKRYYNAQALNIIFAGAIYDERGLLELVKATNLIDPQGITIDLYGRFAPASFIDTIKSIDTHEVVSYHGVISFEEALMKMQEADIGYICDHPVKRHREGLPVKMFEYMATGLPVIASDFPLWSDIVNEYQCGICVDPLDPVDIAKAIEYLRCHPGIRKEMGINGRRAIHEHFNWETESVNLMRVYQEVVGSALPTSSRQK